MPQLTINNNTTVFATTGIRLNVVTLSGPQGIPGKDGLPGTGSPGLYITGSSLLITPTFTGAGSVNFIVKDLLVTISGLDYGPQINSSGSFLYTLITNESGAFDAKLTQSGQQLISYANGIGTNLSGNLTNSGIQLQSLIASASGALNNQLVQSGSTLINYVNSVSGAIDSRLVQTGVQLENIIASTGQQAWLAADNNGKNLSGTIQSSGSILDNKINSESGYANATFATIANLGLTGQALYNDIIGQSGALNTTIGLTGSNLYVDLTGMSGQFNTNFATVSNLASTGTTLYNDLTGLSGQFNTNFATTANLALTGQQAWTAANNNALNLSGRLVASGGLLSAITVTGSTIINAADLSGLGGMMVIWSGNHIYFSGGAGGASAGVSSLNSLTNAVSILGSGGISVIVNGQNIIVSGDQSVSGYITNVSGGLDTRFSNLIASTGSVLYNDLTGMSGQHNTNFATISNLALTGQQAWLAADNNAKNLSGNLTQSGITLLSLISAASAGVSSLNGKSGILTVTGTGNVTVFITGQTFYISGDTGAYANFATVANLALTGSNLYILVTGLSGQANLNYATIANLSLTGSNLYNALTGLSGQANINYATIANLGSTGSILYIDLTGLSGQFNNNFATISNLFSSGSILYNDIVGLSGQINTALASSGSTLYVDLTGLSGQFNTNFATNANLALTGQQAWTAANNNAINLSGNLTQSGITLLSLISAASAGVSSLNGKSGILTATGTGNVTVIVSGQNFYISGDTGAYANFATVLNLASSGTTLYNLVTGLSGQANLNYATITNLGSTGSVLYIDLTGLSGQFNTNFATILNLGSTGSILYNDIAGLSGQFNTNFATVANLASTGQQAWTAANNNGINLSGNLTQTGIALLALIGASSAGVSTLNTMSGNILVTGTGMISVFRTGQTLVISGDTGVYANFASTINLGSTGSVLYIDLTGLSGQFNTNFATIANLGLTGSNLYTALTGLSGQFNINFATVTNLASTGSILYNDLTGLSGQFNTNFATAANLASTGQQAWLAADNNGKNLSGNLGTTGSVLYVDLTGLSGQFNTNFATITNLALTGSNLYIDITGLSGQHNTNFATIANLALTGSALYVDITGLSGQHNLNFATIANLALTGSNLYITLTGMSGQGVIDYATKINLGSTGSTLYVDLTGLSGQFNINFATVSNLASTGQQAWLAADNNGKNLSGNLTQTGVAIENQINSLSGWATGRFLTGLIAGTNITVSNNLNGTFTINSTASGGSSGPVSGTYVFKSGVISGLSNQFINFPVSIGANPIVFASIGNDYDNTVLPFQLSGIVNTGYWLVFANSVPNSGYYVDTLATTTNTGLATTVIVQNNSTIVTGSSLTATGSSLITSADITGLGGTLILFSGGKIFISGGAGGGGDVTSSQLASTGQQAWTAADNNARNLSGNLGTTGSVLYVDLTGLSGQFNTNFATAANLTQSGVTIENQINSLSGFVRTYQNTGLPVLSLVTSIATGVNSVFIAFPTPFISVPSIVANVSITGTSAPAFVIKNPTISGYTAAFSATVIESGLFVNTHAIQTGYGGTPLPQWAVLSGTGISITLQDIPYNYTMTLSGNATFSATGYAQGRRASLYIRGDIITTTVSFPSAWTWIEGQPTSVASGKALRVDIGCTDSTSSGVYAVYGSQK